MSTLTFKVGSTFKVTIGYTPTAGLAPTTLAGVTITSQIRTREGVLIHTLTAVKAGDNLSFTLEAVGGTAAWPYEFPALWDIRFEDTVGAYGVFFSETVNLTLQQRVTA